MNIAEKNGKTIKNVLTILQIFTPNQNTIKFCLLRCSSKFVN